MGPGSVGPQFWPSALFLLVPTWQYLALCSKIVPGTELRGTCHLFRRLMRLPRKLLWDPDLLDLLLPLLSKGWNPASVVSASCLPGHLIPCYSQRTLPLPPKFLSSDCPLPPGGHSGGLPYSLHRL